MPTFKKRPDFFESEEGVLIHKALEDMTVNNSYHTEPSYSINKALYANSLIPFIDKHMLYLRDHPSIDPGQYMSNLRLITKIR